MVFQLQTLRGPMRCMAATNYYPYRANGEVNPKFDKNCGFILSLKDPSSRDFGSAVGHFSSQMSRLVRGMPFTGPAHVMIIPSSKAGKVSSGVIEVMARVCARDNRLILKNDCLVRTKDVEKLATGGSRNAAVHRDSISYRAPAESAKFIFLVDDVTTSGNSLIACCDIIQNKNADIRVFGLALGKTTHE